MAKVVVVVVTMATGNQDTLMAMDIKEVLMAESTREVMEDIKEVMMVLKAMVDINKVVDMEVIKEIMVAMVDISKMVDMEDIEEIMVDIKEEVMVDTEEEGAEETGEGEEAKGVVGVSIIVRTVDNSITIHDSVYIVI